MDAQYTHLARKSSASVLSLSVLIGTIALAFRPSALLFIVATLSSFAVLSGAAIWAALAAPKSQYQSVPFKVLQQAGIQKDLVNENFYRRLTEAIARVIEDPSPPVLPRERRSQTRSE